MLHPDLIRGNVSSEAGAAARGGGPLLVILAKAGTQRRTRRHGIHSGDGFPM